MDDIIFGSTNRSLCEDFVHKMQEEFEMPIMGGGIKLLSWSLCEEN